VRGSKPGRLVVGSFFASDNTCPHCENGYQSHCVRREFVGGAQAEHVRVPLADGTLVPVPGATDVIAERGEEGVARVKELTDGIGADAVLECVGHPDSLRQALHSTRPGGDVGFVGVPHGVNIDGEELFFSHVALRGGPAPVRAFLPDLIDRVLDGRINPGKVFDLDLPLEQAAQGHQAMDERRAVKALLRP
jgi:threonine dehydrogenase-like Zn-dependent dehydrogenase